MPFRLPRAADLRTLLNLALPAIVVQVGLMTMGVVDTVMVGHLSPLALAAVALGNLYYFTVTIFGLGALMALDPVVAQAVGAGDRPAASRGIQRGLLLGAALTPPTMLLLLPAARVLEAARQPSEIVALAGSYAVICAPGTIGIFAFTVLRQSLQALHRMRPIVLATLAANLVNAGLNWVLIYGRLGAPPLGVAGAAWASTISRFALAALLLGLGWPVLRDFLRPFDPAVLDLRALGRLFQLGAPIGAQHQLEYGVFAVIGLLMGSLGTTAVAGHQVALNLASITFMVPLGISTAAAVLVGHAVGRHQPEGARAAAGAALAVSIVFMGATAAVFLALPVGLASLYTPAPEVIAIAAALIPLAGVFQVFDGIQVTAIGILRGLGDTRTPMITGILGFWLLGLPVSLLLGFRMGLGPAGLWWGLVLGLVAVAIFLLARVRSGLNAPLARLQLDQPTQRSLRVEEAG